MSSAHLKHDIHKFHDTKPKLGRKNRTSWKRELLATARDQGLYNNILDKDTLPARDDPNVTLVNSIWHIGSTPLAQLIKEWNDRNDTAYNQILLHISSELQTAIDTTDVASKAWKILLRKFKSTNPSKISIVRTHYNNYHMLEGQSIITYLTTMRNYKNQLEKDGRNNRRLHPCCHHTQKCIGIMVSNHPDNQNDHMGPRSHRGTTRSTWS